MGYSRDMANDSNDWSANWRSTHRSSYSFLFPVNIDFRIPRVDRGSALETWDLNTSFRSSSRDQTNCLILFARACNSCICSTQISQS